MNTQRLPAMSARIPRAAAMAVAVLSASIAMAAPDDAESRGKLLYTTHCIACHTTQIHWRDDKAATDWPSLMFQVRRWQGVASLGWSEPDIKDVARYLNESVYRYPQAPDRLTSTPPPPPAATRVRLPAP